MLFSVFCPLISDFNFPLAAALIAKFKVAPRFLTALAGSDPA